jgi:RNA polymerase sigma-70 factor, ECF subfamily
MVMLTITGLSQHVIGSHAARSGFLQETSDEALISAVADGDRRAMQLLYTRHNVRVYRFVLRLTNDATMAEDLVSEVFFDVWRQAGSFKAQSQVSTWLLAIARHKTLSALRRRPDVQLEECVAAAIEDPADDPETTVHNKDRSAVVQACLSRLSALHREVIDLVYYHEKSVDEVARIVGTRQAPQRRECSTPANIWRSCSRPQGSRNFEMITRSAIIFLLFCTSASFAQEGEPSAAERQGRALAERMCSPCHAIGKSGQSPHSGAPAFRALDRPLNLDTFVERLREGLMVDHPDMPTFRFTREDARSFVLYLRSIQAP